MDNVALYVRLSKEDVDKLNEGDDSVSIRNQRLMLTDYALEHGFKIYGVYSDDDESGLYDDRPGFEKMIEDAKLGKFNIIIAKNQARFSRNMEHIEKYLHHELPLLGVRFIGVLDGADTQNYNNKKSRQINGLVNEWYCEDLSTNIKKVFRAKMQHGQYIGGVGPYGYLVDPKDHNHLVIDPYASEIVKRIFNMYAQGLGKAKIASILTNEGILIPTIYKQKVLGLPYKNSKFKGVIPTWSYQTIHSILMNEVYIGTMVQHRNEKISYKCKKIKKVPNDQWIRIPNMHDPIIDCELWNQVQLLLKRRTSKVDSTPNGIFSGKMFCADCLKSMTHQYQRRAKVGYKRVAIGYVCSTYKKCGKSICSMHGIKYETLESAVMNSIQNEIDRILSEKDLKELSEFRPAEKECANINSHINQLKIQIKKIENYKKKLLEQYTDGVFSQKEFREYIANYDVEEKQLMYQIDKMQRDMEQFNASQHGYLEWQNHFIKYARIEKLDKEIVNELIDRIYVDKNGNITIHYKFSNPFQ